MAIPPAAKPEEARYGAAATAAPRMKRLIHLAGYEPEQRGSFVPFVLTVLSTAKARGWQAEVVFPEGARHRFWLSDFEQAGIPVAFNSGSRREQMRWLEERLGAEEQVMLHTHFTRYDVAAALLARSRGNVHVYWHVHSILSRWPLRIASHVAKFGLVGRSVDRILSPAANVAESVARRGGQKSKIFVFPNAIDPRAFPPIPPARRKEIRRQLEIPADAEVLLHFGRDWYVKGGEVFLDALDILAARGRPVFGIFNRGDAEARRHIAEKGLGERIKMIDLLPDPQLLYGAADVMVAPSRGENMPYSVIESLCSGTPVVASDLPGHRYLGDSLEACAIAPRLAEPFAQATGALLDMGPERRIEICADARRWICERLDVRVAAERLMEDYEETLAS